MSEEKLVWQNSTCKHNIKTNTSQIICKSTEMVQQLFLRNNLHNFD